MSDSIFSRFPELDADYLDAAYDQDAETAALVFQQYLTDLPANLKALSEAFRNEDPAALRQHMHKQKPGFSYVGLTDITATLQQLEAACQSADDIRQNRSAIEQVIDQIEKTQPVIQNALQHLQQL